MEWNLATLIEIATLPFSLPVQFYYLNKESQRIANDFHNALYQISSGESSRTYHEEIRAMKNSFVVGKLMGGRKTWYKTVQILRDKHKDERERRRYQHF